MPNDLTARLHRLGFDVLLISHAQAILSAEFRPQMDELQSVLESMELPISEIIGSGGGETKFTQRARRALAELGWQKHNFIIKKVVDGVERESTSHEVDHVRKSDSGTLGLEIEWNNKDPFFDRDLENFKRLHAEGAISVGIILTRGASLQEKLTSMVDRFAKDHRIEDHQSLNAAGVSPTPKQLSSIRGRTERTNNPVTFRQAWVENFVQNKFGAATTHWAKLMARVARGVGNPCPLLLIGLPASIVTFDANLVEPLDEEPSEQ